MASKIAAACGRSDVFAFYGSMRLPVVGYDDRGRAIVQKEDGSTGLASNVHVRDTGGNRWTFDGVRVSA